MKLQLAQVLPVLDFSASAVDEKAAGKAKDAAESGEVKQAAQQVVDQAASRPRSDLVPPPVAQLQTSLPSGDAASIDVTARDVDGDGQLDAVVEDKSTGAKAALLADGQGRVDGARAISLDRPDSAEVDQLAKTGDTSGRRFLAVDLDGDGTRTLAVKDGEQWLSLGKLAESGAGENSVSALDEAEQRYQWVLDEIDWIVPAMAWAEMGQEADEPGQDAATSQQKPGRMVGFVQMLNGNVDPNPLKSFDLNSDNLGGLTMTDSLGGAVGAFDPFSIGMRIRSGPR